MPGARIKSGERVTLRTVEREDIPFLQRGFTNPAIRYPVGASLKNQDQIEEYFEDESGDGDSFLVCLDEDDVSPGQPNESEVRPIGTVVVTDISWRRPDLVYWLIPEVHGEGYGKEAVSLVVEYVFRVYDTPAVGATVYDFNKASRGLLESLGFTEEGCIRKDRFIDGKYVDTVQYGLLRKEWWKESEM